MKQLERIIQALHITVARHPEELVRGQARQPLLAPYKDAGAVLAAARCGKLPHDERAALVRALIEEHQRHPHALWQAMLTIVFAPTLTWIRRTVAIELRKDDLDQDLLVAFYEALERLPPARTLTWPFLAVRRATARPIFRSVTAAGRQRGLVALLEREEDPDEREDDPDRDLTPPGLVDYGAEDRVAASLDDRARLAAAREVARGSRELEEVIEATEDSQTSLREHVDVTYADEPREVRDEHYERLRRAQRRLETAARARLARPT
jgi:hypothetical protein